MVGKLCPACGQVSCGSPGGVVWLCPHCGEDITGLAPLSPSQVRQALEQRRRYEGRRHHVRSKQTNHG